MALHLGHGDTAELCAPAVWLVHEPTMLLPLQSTNTSGCFARIHRRALFRSCALYLLRLSPLIPLATTTPFNTHARTHPSAPHATNSFLEKDFVPISLSNIQTRPWFKIPCNMIVTPFALLSFSRGREPLFHSAAAIKNIYTSYETTSRNIRRASRMHEY